MLLKHDQQRVKDLLSETITLLCKNSLFFKTEFTVEALIGITLDKSEVLLMNINETITLPEDQKVNRARQESIDKELNLDSVSLKKSAHNDDVDSLHKIKQSRKSESVSSASKSLPSRYRSIAPSFTDSNAGRESPVSTNYDNMATPIESSTLYMPYSSGHKSSSFLASKKKRRIDLSGNSIPSPVAESSSGFADVTHEIKNSSQIRSQITFAHEKNDDEIIDLDLDSVKQEPHDRNYNSSDVMEDEQESRTDDFMRGRSSSNNRRRSFSRNISDEMDQSQSDHKQDQNNHVHERGPQKHQQSELHHLFRDGYSSNGPPPPGFALPYPMPYDSRLHALGDMMAHRSLSSNISSSVPYGLNFINVAPHLYYDDDRPNQSLPTSPLNLQFKPTCDEGERSGKNKILPKEAVHVMTEWLREHQDNPYPNDDEKDSIAASTKLTLNQINYWFTNARRRILPKWALQRESVRLEKALYSSSNADRSPKWAPQRDAVKLEKSLYTNNDTGLSPKWAPQRESGDNETTHGSNNADSNNYSYAALRDSIGQEKSRDSSNNADSSPK